MPNTIDLSFVKQFEADVHLAYQRHGSKLLNTIRRKTNIVGASTTFQTVGKAIAGQKARNGQVPINNLNHAPVECILSDWYSAEFVDKLDELKIMHDERMVAAKSVAAAIGRKADDLVVQAAQLTANATADASGITLPKVEEIFESFGNNDVPDDGMRFMAVSPQGWTDLMALPQFSSADYVPIAEMPYPMIGYTAKRFMSFYVFQFSGLNVTGGGVRSSLAYHQSALGGASGAELALDITWQGKEQAHLCVASMSQGAIIIDEQGVYRLQHTEV